MSEQSGFQLSGDAAVLRERYAVRYLMGPWAPGLVALAALQHGERVLDLAFGTELVTRLAAPEVGPTGQATGLDINAEMLAVARAALVSQIKEALQGHADGNGVAVPDEINLALAQK